MATKTSMRKTFYLRRGGLVTSRGRRLWRRRVRLTDTYTGVLTDAASIPAYPLRQPVHSSIDIPISIVRVARLLPTYSGVEL